MCKPLIITHEMFLDRDIFQPAFLLFALLISFYLFLSLCFCFRLMECSSIGTLIPFFGSAGCSTLWWILELQVKPTL
jgi:hypothetical protein